MRKGIVVIAIAVMTTLGLVIPTGAGYATSIAKPYCPKVEPQLPFKVGHDYGHPAPRKPVVAVLCLYNNLDEPKPLIASKEITNPVGFARAINRSELLPKVQNFACTMDIGPTSIVIFREITGRTSYISHDEYGCGFLLSNLTANKYRLTDANGALWQKYQLSVRGPVGTK